MADLQDVVGSCLRTVTMPEQANCQVVAGPQTATNVSVSVWVDHWRFLFAISFVRRTH